MSSFLFPQKKTMFNFYNLYSNYDMAPSFEQESKIAYVSEISDSTSVTWLLTKRYNSEVKTQYLQFPLFEHLPSALVYEIGEYNILYHTDITAYELYLEYLSVFDGKLVISVTNCDYNDIEIIELMKFQLDFAGNGEFQDGIFTTIENDTVYVVKKESVSNIPIALHFNALDESNNVTSRTIVNLSDLTQDVSVSNTLPVGKYFVLLECKANHDQLGLSKAQLHFIDSTVREQSDVIRFTTLSAIRPYYQTVEDDCIRTYSNVFTIDNSNTMEHINNYNGLICSFKLATDEMSLYREKNILFKNWSNIDATFVMRDAQGTIVHQVVSNDVSYTRQLTDNDEDTQIEIYSNDFTLGGNYDLSCDFTITPCLLEQTRIGNIVDWILVLPETVSTWAPNDIVMTDGLTTEAIEGIIGSGMYDTTTI